MDDLCGEATAANLACVLQDEMFTLLSAILWLGNVQLKHKHARGGGDDTTDVVPGPALSTAARLLGVPEAALVKALSKRNISAGQRSYLAPLL